MTPRRSRLEIVAWATALAAAVWSLVLLGRLDWIAVDWSDPWAWLSAAEVEVAFAALARLAGLVVAGWITLSTLLYVGGRLAGVRAERMRWLSVGPLRRAVEAALAGSLALSSMVGSVALADETPELASTTAVSGAVDPAYVPVPAGVTQPGPEPSEPDGDRDLDGDAAREATPEAGTEVVEGEVQTEVVVTPGDHLWAIASRQVHDVLGRPPTDLEVAPYWVRVVETNRHRIQSGDPDLIYPGETIVLPEVNSGS